MASLHGPFAATLCLQVNVNIFCDDVNDFTTHPRVRDLLPLLVLLTRTLSSCHVLDQVRVGLVLVAVLKCFV